jgi:hypothetical protein
MNNLKRPIRIHHGERHHFKVIFKNIINFAVLLNSYESN